MKKLPVGIENFKELIDNNYYLVDKTNLILNILSDKVALYTRPRRFGKTLNMSMIRYFFDLKQKDNAYLFDDLNIQNYPEALKHQNQYPVLFLTLKDMQKSNMDSMLFTFSELIRRCLFPYENDLINSSLLNDLDQQRLYKYMNLKSSKDELASALLFISDILYKHYGKKVIILIDEYDVPLQYAYHEGFYDEMVKFMRNMFSSALKTNDALEKGIMTGCLRIAKESIFTGLNNFTVHSIFDKEASDCFGFTIDETKQLLKDYDLLDSYDSIKEWYDGYLFGNTEIYNPWSLILSISKSFENKPQLVSFWANTSSNSLVYDYLKQGDETMKQDFEDLVNGKSITKIIKAELTYRDMDKINNIYSFLLFTGYLKVKKQIDRRTYELIIPNKEVHCIFEDTYLEHFDNIKDDYSSLLIQHLKEGNVKEANSLLNSILMSSISFYDNYESFYHGFMTGLFTSAKPLSNRESGSGRFDLAILDGSKDGISLVFEFKCSKYLRDMEADSLRAIEQIKENKYVEGLKTEGYNQIKAYGIAFYGKYCYINKMG